jgi:hypothetical protein
MQNKIAYFQIYQVDRRKFSVYLSALMLNMIPLIVHHNNDVNCYVRKEPLTVIMTVFFCLFLNHTLQVGIVGL